MAIQTTPLADLIQTRLQELGLDRQALGFRLGYQKPPKAAGRVDALCDGHLTSAKSRAVRLPDALEVRADVVDRAIASTQELFVEIQRQAEEERRRAEEGEERLWRARFKPHAVIHTERTVPSQITICGRWAVPVPGSLYPSTLLRLRTRSSSRLLPASPKGKRTAVATSYFLARPWGSSSTTPQTMRSGAIWTATRSNYFCRRLTE